MRELLHTGDVARRDHAVLSKTVHPNLRAQG
jgi:hypothetical protein